MKSQTKIYKQIKSYIDSDNTDYALLLRGVWGCGKTYFVEHEVQSNNELCEKTEFFYYSLNGASDTVNTINSICIELIASQKLQLPPSNNGIARLLLKIFQKFSDSSNFLLNLGYDGMNFGLDFLIKHILSNKDNNNKLALLLDDLERISDAIDITDLLGLIHTKFILNGVKVIYIADDTKITRSSFQKFNTEKEKYIHRIISFYNDKDVVFRSFLEKENIFNYNFMLTLQEIFSEEQINLRSVKFCLDCYVELEKFCKTLPSDAYNSVAPLFYTICCVGKFYRQGNIQKSALINALATYYYHSNFFDSTEISKDPYKNFAREYGAKIINYDFIFDLIYDGIFFDKDVLYALKKSKSDEDSLVKLYHLQEMETNEAIEILKKVKENVVSKKYSIRQYGMLMNLFVANAERFNIATEEEILPLISDSIFSQENNTELQEIFEHWMKDESSRITEVRNTLEKELLSKFEAFSDNKIKNSVEQFFQKIKNCDTDIFSTSLKYKRNFTLLVQMNYVDKILSLKNKSIRFFAYFIDSTICNVINDYEFYTPEIPALEKFCNGCAEKQKIIKKEDILKRSALEYLEEILNNAINKIKCTENDAIPHNV